MPVRCLALLGTGLDGALAAAMMQRAGVEVVAATLATVFTPALENVQKLARQCGVPLEIMTAGADYYERVRHPRFGYTREMAPCLDCRVAMLSAAREMLASTGASFIVTGDVVGQRNPGQSKRDLALVDFHAGVEGLVLRPLSARLLPATIAQERGWVAAENLLAWQGRGRRPQLELANLLGWQTVPSVTSGCLLADAAFGAKLQQLLAANLGADGPLMGLLRIGRYRQIDRETSIVLGRNAEENAALSQWFNEHARNDVALLEPGNFRGPTALLIGQANDEMLAKAAHRIWEASQRPDQTISQPQLRWRHASNQGVILLRQTDAPTVAGDAFGPG